jgi:drug/metabolite transporter (DMT)-like permease
MPSSGNSEPLTKRAMVVDRLPSASVHEREHARDLAPLLLFLPGLLGAVRAAPLSTTLTAVYLGIFPGAIGFVCWTYALAHLPTAHVASFLYLTPLVALGVAWIWLGELPAPLALFGGALVLLGVLVVRFQRRS